MKPVELSGMHTAEPLVSEPNSFEDEIAFMKVKDKSNSVRIDPSRR